MENETNPQREIRLPTQLCEAAERLIQGTRFGTVDELLKFILAELTSAKGEAFEERERKVIEERLRDLGYL